MNLTDRQRSEQKEKADRKATKCPLKRKREEQEAARNLGNRKARQTKDSKKRSKQREDRKSEFLSGIIGQGQLHDDASGDHDHWDDDNARLFAQFAGSHTPAHTIAIAIKQ